jgi:DNA-binding response OmpR family regulator
MNILLLEDDKLFAVSLIDFLEEENFNVEHVTNGEELLSLTYNNKYDLYLLDINVPKINGLESLLSLRQSDDNTPAIFLTSYKDKEILKDGFRSGADDFLTKPVDLDELTLRIKAVLKRNGKQYDVIKIDNLEFNPLTKEIKIDNKNIKLPIKVIELFSLMYEFRGKILTKERIIDKLWSNDENFSLGSIRVYVNKIKQFLKDDSIINIKGVGYKIQF